MRKLKVVAMNKKAFHNYFITGEVDAGIVLQGSEVKSARAGHFSIAESFVKVIGDEMFLLNAYIKPYDNASVFVPDSRRTRKLLLHKKQILQFKKRVEVEGYTIVPIKVFFDANNRLKVQIALGKGKKLYDKREVLKERTINRNIQRYIKI